MQKLNDLSRSVTALEPDGTLIAVIEMSLSSWLVAGIVPGIERQPLKKLAGSQEFSLCIGMFCRRKNSSARLRIAASRAARMTKSSQFDRLRRSDRMSATSFVGTKRTCRSILAMSVVG